MTNEKDFETYMRAVLDSGHGSRQGAGAPPAETWQQVLARVQPKLEENTHMTTINSAAMAVPHSADAPRQRTGFGHYLNLAASIALVLTVALAGWLATMQLNQPGGHDGPFAILGQNDDSATCDVEPMTVDEAMAIAISPLAYMEPDEGFMSPEEFLTIGWLSGQEGAVPGYVSPLNMLAGVELEQASDEAFTDSTTVAQQFLDCVAHGTFGQVWRFVDPVTLHHQIHGLFPMFTSEDEAREILAETIASPVNGEWDGLFVGWFEQEVSIQVNPDQELTLATQQPAGGSVHIVQAVVTPLVFLDSDGNTLLATTVTGFPIETDGVRLSYARNMVLGQSMIDGNWYVIGVVPAESYVIGNS